MAKFYRRLFFWIFFILFLATTPLAIYYSQGYRFDSYKKIFIHSGSITIKSTPTNINIYLNGELQSQRALDIINNSTTINGLRPGNYNVRVAADGYENWEKNVEVHSGVSTEFWNVFLVPKNTSPQQLNAQGATRYFPSPFGKKIAFTKKNGNSLEIWSLTIKNNDSQIIFSQADIDFPDKLLENIEWNFKERLILSPIDKKGSRDFLILDTESNQDPISLKNAAKLSEVGSARWSPNNQNQIYFIANTDAEEEKSLYLFDLETSGLTEILKDVSTFDLSSNAIYFMNSNHIVYKAGLDGENRKQITTSSFQINEEDLRNLRLIAYDDDRQALVAENGKFFIHNNSEEDYIKQIGENIKSVQFSDDGKKILFWSENEISVLYLRKWEVQPRREENETDQIVRFTTPVDNVFWYRDYEHIFFSTQNQVKFVELDSRDHRNMHDVIKFNSEKILSSYDSANGIFYFLDKNNNENNLFFFYIPEQTSFFGG